MKTVLLSLAALLMSLNSAHATVPKGVRITMYSFNPPEVVLYSSRIAVSCFFMLELSGKDEKGNPQVWTHPVEALDAWPKHPGIIYSRIRFDEGRGSEVTGWKISDLECVKLR